MLKNVIKNKSTAETVRGNFQAQKNDALSFENDISDALNDSFLPPLSYLN